MRKATKILCLIGAVSTFIGGIACYSVVYKHHTEVAEQSEVFEELAILLEQSAPQYEIGVNDAVSANPPASLDGAQITSSKYAELYKQNSDMIGWIHIPDTVVNYPVMYTPRMPNYYLKRNFYKANSSIGTPFVQEDCDVISGDNIIVYSHHIRGGQMFGALEQYKKYDFYTAHKTIQFDTLYESGTYTIIAVFKTVADSNGGFSYHEFTNTKDPDEFDAYVQQCKALSLYDTHETAEYGDRLLTLSTCEYSRDNGRLVVVAKKIR